MSTFSTNRTAVGFSFAAAISRFVNTLTVWNDARITRKSLSKLSSRELDDIGLNRGDIDMIATRSARY